MNGSDNPPLLVRDEPVDNGYIRVLSMNRPRKLNALNTALLVELEAALAAADADAQVLGVVLTGEGAAFCAGGDLHEFSPNERDAAMARARLLANLQRRPEELSIPVVAAARGAAVGGGAAMMLAADLVVAGEDLRFGFPEFQRGITPVSVMAGLVRHVGRKVAFDLLTTGRNLSAHKAAEYGIVNRVVAADVVVDEAISLAASFSSISRSTMADTKNLFYAGISSTFAESTEAGLQYLARTWSAPPR